MDTKASVAKVPAIPVVVKKGKPLTVLKNSLPKSNLLRRCIKVVNMDQLIYQSVPGDFLRGEFPGLTLVSRLNIHKQTTTTVAKFNIDGKDTERNSHEIIRVIGQKNYDTIFSALCSVISQELRVRALLALLTADCKQPKDSTHTEKSYSHAACQTDETSKTFLVNSKRRRARRPQFRPYVLGVCEEKKIKRVVVDPTAPLLPRTNNAPKTVGTSPKSAVTPKIETDKESLPELSDLINEESYFSDESYGNVSLNSQHSLNIPQLLHNPKVFYEHTDHHTEALNAVPLTLLDGSVLMVCAKPMDKFHWATPDILKRLSLADQAKLMSHQAIIHWKYCLERDEDGYLPIHQAVLANDLDFLKSQCHALKYKYGSVDVTANGNITPLHVSVYAGGEQCAALLLACGADPRAPDDQGRCYVHAAADAAAAAPAHLQLALRHCRERAREMLMESEDLWRPEMEAYTDDQLVKILLDNICITCDNQGYTPLMLASKQGNYVAVRLLLEASPDTVNRPMPNCGSTALYLAVSAACADAYNSMNQSKGSEKFLKTIELLMEAGGDPSLENHSNSSVNILLTEYNIIDLSVLIANKLTSVKYFDGNIFAASNINSLMLYKNSDGKVDVTDIKSRKPNTDFNSDPNNAITNGPKTAIKEPKVSANKRKNSKSKGSSGKVDDKDMKKKTNNTFCVNKIQIMDIKTIKVEQPVADVELSVDANSVNSVNVKPSQYLIVPKVATSIPDVTKFVKIMPKLEKDTANDSIKTVIAPKIGKVTTNINSLVKIERPKKRKKIIDNNQLTVGKDVKANKKKYIVNLTMSPPKQYGKTNDESNSEPMNME